MASRRASTRKRAQSGTSQQTYPTDAFYAPLFKDNQKKLQKFLKWINAASTDDITQILLTINEKLLTATTSSSTHKDHKEADKLSKKLEIIVLADIIQCGYRSYGLLNQSESDRKYEKELTALGISNADIIKMILKLIKKVYKTRNLKIENVDESDVSYPHFQSLRWRLDVTISNSNLKRVLKPSLVLQFTMNDGRIKYMECSIDKFHELRFNVSRVLREMQVLQQRFIDPNDQTQAEQQAHDKAPQYIVKYTKLASIAGLNNLSQIVNSNDSQSEQKTDQ